MQVFAVVQSSIIFHAVTKGFGKTITDIPPTDLVPLQKVCQIAKVNRVYLHSDRCCTGFVCGRHLLCHHGMADEILRRTSLSSPVCSQKAFYHSKRDFTLGHDHFGHCMYHHCCSTLWSCASLDLHRNNMQQLGKINRSQHPPPLLTSA